MAIYSESTRVVRVEKKCLMSYVLVVCEFPNDFLKDIPDFPSKRQAEFRIDFVSGAASNSKLPYRLTPPEM